MKGPDLAERLRFYERLIAPLFPSRFPAGFKLAPSDVVLAPVVTSRAPLLKLRHGRHISVRAIGTLDIELLSNALVKQAQEGVLNLQQSYPCSLKCPGCFSEDEIYADSQNLMTWQEVFEIIDVARTIGLTSIKFLGPGEIFQNPDLFDILDACRKRALPIAIFTKGAELGDDELTERYFAPAGIHTARELVKRIVAYDEVRILLGFNSFFPRRQEALVGGLGGYTEKRDRALKNLTEAGLHLPERGQRLALVMAPLYSDQGDEAAEAYLWAARRNMPLIIAPTMESGPKARRLAAAHKESDLENHWIFETYLRVYRAALKAGLETIESLEEKGISPYMGIDACNQVAHGLMLRLNGQIKICPGSSRAEHIYGNVHSKSGFLEPERFIDLWVDSMNYRLGPLNNNWCPAKEEMLPSELQSSVLQALRKEFIQAPELESAG